MVNLVPRMGMARNIHTRLGRVREGVVADAFNPLDKRHTSARGNGVQRITVFLIAGGKGQRQKQPAWII